MTHKTLAGLAGALLLSTAGFAFAQGTTVVPAGQSAPTIEVAQNDSSGTNAAEETGSAAAQESGSSDSEAGSSSEQPAASDASDQGSNAESVSNSQTSGGDSGSEASSSGPVTAENVSNPEPSKTPSADTKAESNEVASFKPNDAGEDPGLALDTAEKPVYAFNGETPDWYTWRGYKKYGANCLQCHGPDGMGSSFAPNLTESLQDIDYYEFAGIIVGGQQNQWNSSGNSIMPAWGEDPNVMCSLNAIYVYLRGRADGVVGRGEPPRPDKSDKSEAAKDYEYSCLGF
ncbi:hypothetical protein [Fulvimarina sp. MAC3]|uniref:hypothetical protein n=1 Tax=Fulvimarina sp. MAC3 TaxID=3148887 RepID=UPI0031FD45DE